MPAAPGACWACMVWLGRQVLVAAWNIGQGGRGAGQEAALFPGSFCRRRVSRPGPFPSPALSVLHV